MPISLDDVSIVLKGNFNPSILSPAWMLAQGVVGQEEHDQADVEVITRDISSFSCAWLKVFASQDTLQLSTSVEAEFERLRDAVVAVLASLSHTPVAVLGINRSVHFRVETVSALHRVGDVLAPKELWDGVLEFPGMRSLTMWGARPGLQSGRVQVVVEPSNALPQAVFVAHNDHYELSARDHHPREREEAWLLGDLSPVDSSADKLQVAIQILTQDWRDSMLRAQAVVRRVHMQAIS